MSPARNPFTPIAKPKSDPLLQAGILAAFGTLVFVALGICLFWEFL
ncbi:hypothetical protein [Tianweitania sediminis]|uniref:Uncharacterized protein n=1 Tax=Tianweitania sediminis TaxID=1502156 RepID=A0A8J7QZE7_9HYPH|nr:hypothetical protein [Tianweitania sediminis]MBP0439613.1 hypothetical protein [Tianweitania sediminis]